MGQTYEIGASAPEIDRQMCEHTIYLVACYEGYVPTRALAKIKKAIKHRKAKFSFVFQKLNYWLLYCQCGYCSVSFQHFMRHVVITPVRNTNI